MQIGCHLPTQGPVATREALMQFCRAAEARQMASLWVSDHVVFPTVGNNNYPSGRFPHAPHTPYLEPVTVLAAAAMCTERARIGSSVFILGHRNPVVMAKMLTTIDTLSNGRLICGVGVGWWREDASPGRARTSPSRDPRRPWAGRTHDVAAARRAPRSPRGGWTARGPDVPGRVTGRASARPVRRWPGSA